MARNRQRGRKDHYIPQGYLRGFIDPARASFDKPLWHFDVETGQWSEKSPSEVGWERGFYDYATDTDLEHPDVTFARFEREFPLVREHMLRSNFKGWVKQHKGFLLGYMQMMRARSPLFIEQRTEANRSLRAATITSVGPGNQVTVDSLEMRPLPEAVQRNVVISQVRQEINKGPDWMWNFNWCLRYTKSTSDHFVTGSQPVIVTGPAPTIEGAIRHPDTFIWFPICRQACLIGNLARFDEGTDEADPSITNHVRGLFKQQSSGYVISPRNFDQL